MRLLSLFLLCFFMVPSVQADLPPPVLESLRKAKISPDAVAVVVHPVDGLLPTVKHHADLAMNPASVMKLVTTYAAFDALGPAFTWKTDILTDTAPVDEVLSGSVYIKGSGDPRLNLENLTALLRRLRVRGITTIEGNIVLDRTVFDLPPADPDAFDKEGMRPYNVQPNALLLDFQALGIALRVLETEGSEPKVVALLETPSEGIRLDNQLRLTKGNCGDWRNQIAFQWKAEGGVLQVSGSFDAACAEKTVFVAPFEKADDHAARLIQSLWQMLGGSLKGKVIAGKTPLNAKVVASHESQPLSVLVQDINKFSNNVMARQLYLTLGTDFLPATLESSRIRVFNILAARRLTFPELVIENGSGLSRKERISAGSLNRLLISAWHSTFMPEFMSSLPIAGVDGTMKKRLRDTLWGGRVRIKTGTLTDVKSASGFVLDQGGKYHAVTMLINHQNAEGGGDAIDTLLRWVGGGNAGSL